MSVHQSLAVEACWLGELCKCLRVEEGDCPSSSCCASGAFPYRGNGAVPLLTLLKPYIFVVGCGTKVLHSNCVMYILSRFCMREKAL